MNALLPKDCEQQTLDQLDIDESAWTVPWAMGVDPASCCWLHPKYSTSPLRGGTAQLLVTRLADGYHVVCYNKAYKWTISFDFHGKMGWLPVVSFSNDATKSNIE